MTQRKSHQVQRRTVRVVDVLVPAVVIGGLAATMYSIPNLASSNNQAQKCMEWRQDIYDTRELCQIDHPQYSCLDRDAATGKWLGTTYAKNICTNGTSSSGGGNSGSGGSGSYTSPDSPNASRSVSRGGFGGFHGSGGG